MDLFLEIKYSKCSGKSKGAGRKEMKRKPQEQAKENSSKPYFLPLVLGLEVQSSFVAGCVWVSPYLLTAFSVGSRQDASHSAVANHANQI